jgi:hypothetical protein
MFSQLCGYAPFCGSPISAVADHKRPDNTSILRFGFRIDQITTQFPWLKRPSPEFNKRRLLVQRIQTDSKRHNQNAAYRLLQQAGENASRENASNAIQLFHWYDDRFHINRFSGDSPGPLRKRHVCRHEAVNRR